MYPSYVIHHDSCHDRDDIVKDIINKTKATVFQSYWLAEGLKGNTYSHIGVAKLAKTLHPDSKYIVFEDDCEILSDYNVMLESYKMADVLYLGYSDRCSHTTFGTHALVLSPKARDCIIQKAAELGEQVDRKWAFDWILSKLCRQEGLVVCMPNEKNRESFCRQKKGIQSYITGQVRK